jgi:hypothetical protein
MAIYRIDDQYRRRPVTRREPNKVTVWAVIFILIAGSSYNGSPWLIVTALLWILRIAVAVVMACAFVAWICGCHLESEES